jgi:mannose-6-phosphate isomerase-like protein (cupin superfamily)
VTAVERLGSAIVSRGSDAQSRDLRLGRGRVVRLTPEGLTPVVEQVTIDVRTPAGPYHLHRRATNTYVCLTGRLSVLLPDGTVTLGPGDTVVIPPGEPHATHNPGTSPAVLLAIYDRPVEDDFEWTDSPPPWHP